MLSNEIFIAVKEFFEDLKEKFNLKENIFSFGWRFILNSKFILKLKLSVFQSNLKYGKESITTNKVYQINPNQIKYYLEGKYNRWHNQFKILEGNWGHSKLTIGSLDIYQAFFERFINKKEWNETKFYKRIYDQLSKGFQTKSFTNLKQFEKSLTHIDLIFTQFKKKLNKSEFDFKDNFNEIYAVIDENGRFLLVKGIIPLYLSKLLNLDKVPVRLIARHKRWKYFKKEIILFSKKGRNKKLYQRLIHPDLQDIPYQHGEYRFKIIKKNLSSSKRTMLDIGANLGYFSKKFGDLGFQCYTVETNWNNIYFLKKLKKAYDINYKIIPGSIFKYRKNKELNFDIILALNIFHHFLKTKQSYLNLKNLLKRLNPEVMFFEPHLTEQFKGKNTYRNYEQKEFIEFILKNSSLNKVKFLGEMEDGRSLYKIIK